MALSTETHKICALNTLQALRESDCRFPPGFIAGLRQHIQKSGCSLAELGTSEEELAKLERGEFIKGAKECLRRLRHEDGPYQLGFAKTEWYRGLIEEMNAGQLSAKECGTTKHELAELAAKWSA